MSFLNSVCFPRRLLSLSPGSNIERKTLKGAAWIFWGKTVGQIGRLLRLTILARLLAPEDFGLMGVALLALGCLEIFTETGLQTTLIQRSGDIQPYLDTAWTIQVLRGICITVLVYAVAGPLAGLFGNVQAAPVVTWVGVIALLRGFTSPAVVHFNRALDFKRLFFWNLSEVITSLLAAVPLAFVYRNVWALLLSALISQATLTLGSYLIHPYRPRPRMDWNLARELNRFGKWVMASNVVVFLSLQGDTAFVAKTLGLAAVGIYQVAFRTSELPVSWVSQVMGQALFPALSQLQTDPVALRQHYFHFTRYLLVITGGVGLALILAAEPLVRYALGEQWDEAVPVLRVLVLAAVLRSVLKIGGALFVAAGHPNLDFSMNAMRLVVMAACISPLTARFGLTGAGLAVLLSMTAMIPVYLYGIRSVLGIRCRETLRLHTTLARYNGGIE
jgi:lipopolysaccharide exporter